MVKIVTPANHQYLDEAISLFRNAEKVVVLSGAGISVESGIDDFRSPGGLWERFPPQEYGTFSAFRRNPEKAWQLFRLLGTTLQGKKPNPAHHVLARLERKGLLTGIITQNIDGLHQQAGSKNVLEIHGDAGSLHCIQCGFTTPFEKDAVYEVPPHCALCDAVLKPNVVLFEEQVRFMEEASDLLQDCDLILVVGTSAQVYPAAAMPRQVKMRGWGCL